MSSLLFDETSVNENKDSKPLATPTSTLTTESQDKLSKNTSTNDLEALKRSGLSRTQREIYSLCIEEKFVKSEALQFAKEFSSTLFSFDYFFTKFGGDMDLVITFGNLCVDKYECEKVGKILDICGVREAKELIATHGLHVDVEKMKMKQVHGMSMNESVMLSQKFKLKDNQE